MGGATNGLPQKNSRWRNIALGTARIVGSLLAGSSAYADPAHAATDSEQLAAITVTAQGHMEYPQRVPISVASITPEAALNAGAFRTDMLAHLVPGVQMGHEIDSATTFIRGIGSKFERNGRGKLGRRISR
jgi:hypothetical protein